MSDALALPHDVEECIAPEASPRTRAPRDLACLTLADCASAAPRGYVLKGLIAPGDLAILFGPPGAGKSVIAPLIAHAIAAGRETFGRRVRRAPVLYVAAEDPAGMRMRAAALLRAHGDAPGLFIVTDPIDLQGDGIGEPPDLAAIVALADRIGAGLVIIDTIAAAFPGLDENDGRAMGRAVHLLRRLRSDRRAVLAVHHGAKANGTTPRGHGVLDGAADVTMRIEVPDDRAAPRVIHLGKNRNGTTLASFAFSIRAETLGTDDDGDAITAPLAVEVEDDAPGTRQRLTGKTLLAWRILMDVVATEGTPPPASLGLPGGLLAVPLARWRDACRERALAETPEAVRKAVARAFDELRAKGFIAAAEVDGRPLVWPARREP